MKEAALAYSDYLKRHPKGRYVADAVYERALVRLSLGEGSGALADLDVALARTEDERERSALTELRGLALLRAGQTDRAKEVWQRSIQEAPLSFEALTSAARLAALGVEAAPLAGVKPAPEANANALEIAFPEKIARLVAWGLHRDAEAELYATRESFLAKYDPRGEEALCQAFGSLSTAERRYGFAHRVVPERVLMRPVAAETRWQWDCIYPRPYALEVRAQEQRHGVPEDLVYAIMRQESAFKPEVVSSAGAIGLMQLMPATAARASEELGRSYAPELLTSPPHNIELGAFYVGKMLQRFDGHVALAAAAYNAGPNAVQRWLDGGKELPLDVWVARIPYLETRNYVRRVVGNWARYRYLEAGVGGVPKLALELPRVEARDGEY